MGQESFRAIWNQKLGESNTLKQKNKEASDMETSAVMVAAKRIVCVHEGVSLDLINVRISN